MNLYSSMAVNQAGGWRPMRNRWRFRINFFKDLATRICPGVLGWELIQNSDISLAFM